MTIEDWRERERLDRRMFEARELMHRLVSNGLEGALVHAGSISFWPASAVTIDDLRRANGNAVAVAAMTAILAAKGSLNK